MSAPFDEIIFYAMVTAVGRQVQSGAARVLDNAVLDGHTNGVLVQIDTGVLRVDNRNILNHYVRRGLCSKRIVVFTVDAFAHPYCDALTTMDVAIRDGDIVDRVANVETVGPVIRLQLGAITI